MAPPLRIGTRGSPLALAQARETQSRLAAAANLRADAAGEIMPITTSGDRLKSKALREFGGKGLFTKEVEEALLAEEVDLAVHSLKDMPTELPSGLILAAYLPREDVREAFISSKAKTLSELPQGAKLGAASLRRVAQAKHQRPDLNCATLRGNVSTRLQKAENGEVDATFLAAAGLKRLGKLDRAASLIDTETMLPALGQGVICIEARADDTAVLESLAMLNHPETAICVAAERAFLAALDGSCRTPIAGLATYAAGELTFAGEVYDVEGVEHFRVERRAALALTDVTSATKIGLEAGEEIRRTAGDSFFEALKAASA